MCGIAGFHAADGREAEATCRSMLAAIALRGPDGEGTWNDPSGGVWLGHRRLAIQDLTETGRQPMASHSGRYVIAYNGELYNAPELRKRLEAARDGGATSPWKGHSDTEILLEAVEAWGLEKALRSFYGMFAFALWDRSERLLHLARDRFGEKPLYWGWQGDSLLFASELKALRRHPSFRGDLDPVAIASFLERGYVPAPLSVYQGVSKVEPGTWLTFNLGTGVRQPRQGRYWSLLETVAEAKRRLAPLEPGEGVDALEHVLSAAVSRQLLSDVPLGAFLSGGIDSSLIVATMCKVSSTRVKTFTIGFRDADYDEAGHAEKVARHLGTEHTCLYVSGDDALAVIPRLAAIYDEPFADDSQIPTFLIARLARTAVTVALSGDAGDELFGGYNRYFHGVGLWERAQRIPLPLRRAAAGLGRGLPQWAVDGPVSALMRLLPRRRRLSQPGAKVLKGLRMLGAASTPELHGALLSRWHGEELPLRDRVMRSQEWPTLDGAGPLAPVEQLMCLDALTYLPDDILVKVDRAAMANSLETRVPFLDPDVVTLAWGLPLSQKVAGGSGKLVLKELLRRSLPGELFERPKAGFGLPVAAWLRGPLRTWASGLLERPGGALDGLLDMPRVGELWKDHLSARRDASGQLWPVLMLAGWLEGPR